jgi:hypothetical protein
MTKSGLINRIEPLHHRPVGLVALSAFAAFGALMSGLTAVLLLFPGSRLDAIWRLNPDARIGFAKMGAWSIVLMSAVCIACVCTAIGIWKRAEWGRRLACAGLAVNMLGDLTNAIVRSDPRTLIGLPIAGALIAYLMSRRIRDYFSRTA